jgi:hypothetical protein
MPRPTVRLRSRRALRGCVAAACLVAASAAQLPGQQLGSVEPSRQQADEPPEALRPAFALLAGTAASNGQWRAEPRLQGGHAPSTAGGQPTVGLPDSLDVKLTLVGIAAVAVGTVAGVYLGYQLDRNHFNWGCTRGCEDPGLRGAIGGWFVGPAVTAPLSVHLANGRRGSLPAAYLSSALIAGAGMAGLLAAPSQTGTFFLLVAPVAQVVSAVLIEGRGAR